MAIKHPFVMAAVLAGSLFTVAAREVYAMRAMAPVSHAHVLRVDDDEGDDEGGDWFPLWFGFRAFAPRRRVIIEHDYYPPPRPARPAYYYYCRDPEGYYPRVPNCPSGWLRVVPPGPGGPP